MSRTDLCLFAVKNIAAKVLVAVLWSDAFVIRLLLPSCCTAVVEPYWQHMR